ncbi:MAG: TfpX/TfpZ family type IV pilin accessory protein [Candidatus Aquirickettsiella gammari]
MLTNRLSDLNRYQAFGLHFLVSATVITFLFAFVKFIWFPHQLFEVANGLELLKILILVDLILGPLIMLVIFNPKKKSLKFDVTAVLICQLLFLGYGVWSLYTVRPVYLAFVEKQFILVKANEIEDTDIAKVSIEQFKQLPQLGPVFVGTQSPDSQEKREEILFAGLGNMGIENLPQYYVDYAQVRREVLAASKDLSQQNLDKASKEQLENIQQKFTQQGKKVLFCPLKTKAKQLFVVIDASNGDALMIN